MSGLGNTHPAGVPLTPLEAGIDNFGNDEPTYPEDPPDNIPPIFLSDDEPSMPASTPDSIRDQSGAGEGSARPAMAAGIGSGVQPTGGLSAHVLDPVLPTRVRHNEDTSDLQEVGSHSAGDVGRALY